MTESRAWYLSFFFTMFAFRYVLTPIGTIYRIYVVDSRRFVYLDIYVFGVRVVRAIRFIGG